MEALLDAGIRFVVALQSVPWLEAPMRFFTFLGTQEFFLLLLPAFYWCIDAGLGIRIGFILLIGNAFNEWAKILLQGPRPYWISSEVKALAADSSFGAPSGHAQLAMGVWGVTAAAMRRPWAWIASGSLIFLIGISRLYLGVHFPHDALIGWLLGGVTLWAFLTLWKPTSEWLAGRTLREQIWISVGAAAALLLAGAMIVNARSGYAVPEAWLVNARRAGEPLPDPVTMNPMLTAAGTLLGFSVGLALLRLQGAHRAAGPTWKRIMAYVMGVAGILVLYLGLKVVFPEGDTLLGMTLRFVRYALIGLWAAAGAPWIFRQVGLVPQPRGREGRSAARHRRKA